MSGVRAPHLQRRNGVYHLRMRVPDAVRPRLGRCEVRRSLATYNVGRARTLAARYAARVLEAFEMIRSEEFSREDARTLVVSCFSDLNVEMEAQGGFVPSTDDPDQECSEQHEMSLERISDLGSQLRALRFDGSVQGHAERLLNSRSLALSELSSARQIDLMSGVARALVEQQRLFLLRIEDRIVPADPIDPLFQDCSSIVRAPQAAAMPLFESIFPVRGPTVGEAVRLYLAAGERQWVRKTFMARQWQLRYLQEHLGSDTVLASVSSHDIRAYRDGILALRANHGRTQSQSFLEKQTDNPVGRIADKTASLIFEVTKAFLRWCEEAEGLIPTNPSKGVRLISAKKIKGQKPRRPFRGDELERLFSAPLFTGCQSAHRRYAPGARVIWDAKFWIPILAYYTGARMGELVQLHLTDVHLGGPIPYLSINEENDLAASGDRKHVKSAAAVRLVPLHPDVLELGFGDFLTNRRGKRKSSARLFHEVPYGSDGQASTVFSKWFARFLDQAGLSDPSLVFHSFRHNAEDAFRNAGQQQYVIDRIIGHSDGAVSAQYGDGIDLETAYSAIQAMKLKLRLPDLGLGS